MFWELESASKHDTEALEGHDHINQKINEPHDSQRESSSKENSEKQSKSSSSDSGSDSSSKTHSRSQSSDSDVAYDQITDPKASRKSQMMKIARRQHSIPKPNVPLSTGKKPRN